MSLLSVTLFWFRANQSLSSSSSSHQNVTCSRHDMAENVVHFPLTNNHSLTQKKFVRIFVKLSLDICYALWTFYLLVYGATFQQYLHMEHISLGASVGEAVPAPLVTPVVLIWLQTRWYVLIEARNWQCLREVEHIRGHLWHRYSITVNQVMVATVNRTFSFCHCVVCSSSIYGS
jgi:hypothetical protein